MEDNWKIETFTQKRYRCVYCRRSWAKREACSRHLVLGCPSDPATKTCKTCKFLHGYSSCDAGIDLPEQKQLRPVGCQSWERFVWADYNYTITKPVLIRRINELSDKFDQVPEDPSVVEEIF